MDLFPEETPSPKTKTFTHGEDFAAAFAETVRQLPLSGRSSTKNRPLETLLATATGWPSITVKYIGTVNNLTNRVGEAGKKVGASRNVVMLVPAKHLGAALRTAVRLVGRGKWDLIAIGAPDVATPELVHVVHVPAAPVPAVLPNAFPALNVHVVNVASGDAVETPPSASEAVRQPKYSWTNCSEETGVPAERLATWQRILLRKKHLVLQGPPGTGKTFLAKRLARAFVSETPGEIELVQFHPSLTYEDFVQGIRANVEEGQMRYELEPGRFLQFCEEARAIPDAPFVLIIDELNRGNVARVFGELLYLLEYRDETLALAQGQEPFSVPPNVYLLGTMNTADRSIALVDHALRRRFSFVFVGPDYERLRQWLLARDLADGGQLVAVLERINERIEDKHYHLGTSYFLGAGVDLRTCLQDIWEGEIEPHLEEFFFDRRSIVEEFAWKTLKKGALSWWAQPSTAPREPAAPSTADA